MEGNRMTWTYDMTTDKTLDKNVAGSGLPVYGEVPMFSDSCMRKWRVVRPRTMTDSNW